MADYRTCTVGHDRHFIGHRAFVCENDADATEWAKQQLTVTKLSFGTRGASSPCSQCEKRAPGGDHARGRVTVSRKPAAPIRTCDKCTAEMTHLADFPVCQGDPIRVFHVMFATA
jgi:hypothetical protein